MSESNGSAAAEPPPSEAPNQPVMKFGPYAVEGGNLSVAVWDKVIKLTDGREFTVYTTSVQGEHFDEQAGEWKETRYWRGESLPILVHALNEAHAWILRTRAEAGHKS